MHVYVWLPALLESTLFCMGWNKKISITSSSLCTLGKRQKVKEIIMYSLANTFNPFFCRCFRNIWRWIFFFALPSFVYNAQLLCWYIYLQSWRSCLPACLLTWSTETDRCRARLNKEGSFFLSFFPWNWVVDYRWWRRLLLAIYLGWLGSILTKKRGARDRCERWKN